MGFHSDQLGVFFFGTNDARSISEVVNVFKVGLEGIGISCGWPGGVSAPN